MTSSVLTVWMSDARQIHHGTAEENKEMDKNKEYDVSTNEQQSLESSYSMDSTQEQDSDFTSSSEYDESHEFRGKKPRVNNDRTKSRTGADVIIANCGATVDQPCCPEKQNAIETAEETNNPGGLPNVETKCVCRCAEKVVDTSGTVIETSQEGSEPRFCLKGQGSWPGLAAATKSSQSKHHKLKYKKP